jgi:hypothetical protein
MHPRAAPPYDDGRGRGRGRGRGGDDRGRGRGRGRGGSEFGGSRRGSDYGSIRSFGNRGSGRGRGRGDRGSLRGGSDRGGYRGRDDRSRDRGIVVDASLTASPAVVVEDDPAIVVEDDPAVVVGAGPSVVVEADPAVVVEADTADVGAGAATVEAGGHFLTLPTLSRGRTGPLPAEHTAATGVRRRQYGNAGRSIKLISNHFEFKFDQKTLYHYDGMYIYRTLCKDK